MVISVKGTYTVYPAKETPRGLMYLSEFDHIPPKTHISAILFYRRPSSDLHVNPFQTLKRSLSQLLSIFYPLAGRLQCDQSRNRLEINCNSAGALLVEAESDSVVDDFGDFCPSAAVTELLPPPIDYKSLEIDQQPLLLAQFTQFSCGGIGLGLYISHVLADGASATHFVSEWARISRGDEPRNLPFLDRTVLRPSDQSSPSSCCDDHPNFMKTPLLIGQTNSSEERRKETTEVMLRLSKDQLEILKSKANNGGRGGGGGGPFSTFEVVSAHMWRCACKARKHKPEQETVLRFPVSFRSRIKPNLPKWYFGNASMPVWATATAGELLSEPLSYACGKIRETMLKVNDEYVKSSASYFKTFKHPTNVVGSKEERPFLGNPVLLTNTWSAMMLQTYDFGWGKDIHLGPGSLGHDGRSIMFSTRDEESSLVVALSLQVAHVDAFKKFFYVDDILRNTKL